MIYRWFCGRDVLLEEQRSFTIHRDSVAVDHGFAKQNKYDLDFSGITASAMDRDADPRCLHGSL